MLGLGEKKEEVISVLKDIRKAGADIITIGQYLSPDSKSLPVERYLMQEEYDGYKTAAEYLGFTGIASAPFVRSSYYADRMFSKDS
jgi:lipoic acid synthetase